eukprot:6133758-Pyramimonas_sp.AAC.1
MDTLNDFLKLMEDSSEHSRVMITGAIMMCRSAKVTLRATTVTGIRTRTSRHSGRRDQAICRLHQRVSQLRSGVPEGHEGRRRGEAGPVRGPQTEDGDGDADRLRGGQEAP